MLTIYYTIIKSQILYIFKLFTQNGNQIRDWSCFTCCIIIKQWRTDRKRTRCQLFAVNTHMILKYYSYITSYYNIVLNSTKQNIQVRKTEFQGRGVVIKIGLNVPLPLYLWIKKRLYWWIFSYEDSSLLVVNFQK